MSPGPDQEIPNGRLYGLYTVVNFHIQILYIYEMHWILINYNN